MGVSRGFALAMVPLMGVMSLACGLYISGTDDEGRTDVAPDAQRPSDGVMSTTDALEGECEAEGKTRRCCSGGRQKCTANGEVLVWGPCTDKEGADLACDGGVEDGGVVPKSGNVHLLLDGGPADSTDRTRSACSPKMVCRPGAVRYCSVKDAGWTKSTCSTGGEWGSCLPAVAPAGKGCNPMRYEPEKCCAEAELCCQTSPGGAFDDFGTGACDELACP